MTSSLPRRLFLSSVLLLACCPWPPRWPRAKIPGPTCPSSTGPRRPAICWPPAIRDGLLLVRLHLDRPQRRTAAAASRSSRRRPDSTGFTVDPHDPSRLFLFAGGHLQRSTDAGRSWLPVLPAPPGTLPGRPCPRPARPAGSTPSVQDVLWRSDDGGATFGRRGALAGGDDQPIAQLEEAADSQLYLLRSAVCAYHSCGNALSAYRSADQGASWQPIFAGHRSSPVQPAADPSDPSRDPLPALRLPQSGRPRLVAVRRPRRHLHPGGDGARRPAADRPVPAGPAARDQRIRHLPQPRPRSDLAGAGAARSAPGQWHAAIRRDLSPAAASGSFAEPNRAAGLAFFDASSRPRRHLDRDPPRRPFPGIAAALTAGAVPGLFYCSPAPSRLATSWDGGFTWTHRDLPAGLELLAADPREAGVLYARLFENFTSTVYRSADGGATFLPISPPFDGYIADFKAFPYAGRTALVAVTDGRLDDPFARRPDLERAQAPPGSGFPSSPQWRFVLVDGAVLYAITDHTELYRSARRRRELGKAERRPLRVAGRRRHPGRARSLSTRRWRSATTAASPGRAGPCPSPPGNSRRPASRWTRPAASTWCTTAR